MLGIAGSEIWPPKLSLLRTNVLDAAVGIPVGPNLSPTTKSCSMIWSRCLKIKYCILLY